MSKHKFIPKTEKNYSELVDHLVNTMTKPDPPFDTTAYANYKAQVDNYRRTISNEELTETIYKLGFKIDTAIDKIINQLDTISEGIEEDLNDNVEEEITVDPLTHKVTYNKKTNVYNVVKREDVK